MNQDIDDDDIIERDIAIESFKTIAEAQAIKDDILKDQKINEERLAELHQQKLEVTAELDELIMSVLDQMETNRRQLERVEKLILDIAALIIPEGRS